MVNEVTLIGNLGETPEVRHTEAGTAVCNISVATNERYKNKEGEMVDSTEWHKVVCWDKLAENVGRYLRKGSKVYVKGSIHTRKFEDTDEDGNDRTRYFTEIKARNVQFLDPKPEGTTSDADKGGDNLPF